jgi:formate/nitrite transporter FocA (FNT family)
LFSIGLFTVFTFSLDLYTGKVGYIVENDRRYILYLIVVILGNFVGCLLMGYAFSSESAEALAAAKLNDPDYLRVLFKGIMCGVLMFIAADYYKVKKGYLATFICVPVFILAGFEHSIADMFYFCAAGEFTLEALIFILVVIVGNGIGGAIIPAARKWMYDPQP